MALLRALQPKLDAATLVARVIEDEDTDAWANALSPAPALTLLLPARDAAGESQDLEWRMRLSRSGIAFSVLYGDLQAQLESALRLVDALRGAGLPPGCAEDASPRWGWCCDRCSDAACEHRLFKDLLQRRGAEGTAKTLT